MDLSAIKKVLDQELLKTDSLPLKGFKIGKTSDLGQRQKSYETAEDENDKDFICHGGNISFLHLASGSPEAISYAETELIKYYQNLDGLSPYCANKISDSTGNDRADKLYVVIVREAKSENDLGGVQIYREGLPVTI